MTSKETRGELLDGLLAAHKAYRESGGSFEALVTAILSSDSFLYRTPKQTAAVDNKRDVIIE
jgi:hypothetical protein